MFLSIDRPASSSSDTKLSDIASMRCRRTRRRRSSKESNEIITSPSACCDCIPTTGARNSIQLSEIYSPSPEHITTDSPACLTTITKNRPSNQIKTLLNVESEIEYSKNFNKKLVLKKIPPKANKKIKSTKQKELSKTEQDVYEIACEAADADDIHSTDEAEFVKILTESDKKHMIRVNGKEELPCVEEKQKKSCKALFLKKSSDSKKSPKKSKFSAYKNKINESSDQCVSNNNVNIINSDCHETTTEKESKDESDGNNNRDEKLANELKFSTLPMVKKQKNKRTISIPQRITPDGTKIFYICDLPKKIKKGLFPLHYLYQNIAIRVLKMNFLSIFFCCRT